MLNGLASIKCQLEKYLIMRIRNHFLIYIVSILFVTNSMAQTPDWQWVKSAGGLASDKATDMAIDKNAENVFICGYFNQHANFGSITPPSGFGKEGFLAKIDSSGNWQWALSCAGGYDERVLGMCVDSINNFIYVTGTYWAFSQTELLTFGNGICNSNPGDADEIFVGKFDYSGNCIWLIAAGGESDDHGYDLVTDSQGNIYLTGFISNEYFLTPEVAHFGTLQSTLMYEDDSLAFVAKISPSGNFIWLKTFEAVDGERDNRIAVDMFDNVYVAGGYWGTKQFGSQTMVSNGGTDIFVIKFDSSGTQQWVKSAGGVLDDRANSIIVDIYGDLYITGEFRDRFAFGNDSINNNGSPGGRDIFVAKMTQAGNWVWAKKAGSNSGSERGNRISGNSKGNLFVTGEIMDNAKFGNGITLSTNGGGVQIFVASIDTSGKWKWALTADGISEDRGNAIVADNNCNLYSTGYYQSNVSFNSTNNLIALGAKDAYVGRLTNTCVEQVIDPPIQTDSSVVLICETLQIPNVFTPNNDNSNDVFSLKSNCVESIDLKIYNRWGKLIKQLNSMNDTWDGTFNGELVSPGVYYYITEGKLTNNDVISLKGFINLFY